MGVKVCKFGGSSLADAGMIRKVQKVVEADGERRYVVPSAPGKRNKDDQKITDLLYLCHAHAKQGVPFDDVFAIIAERYKQIVADLGVKLDMTPLLDEVKAKIAGGASEAYAASRGEALNGPIIAATLGYAFIDAADVVKFDGRGRFDIAATDAAMNAALAAHERAVVPGFYGASPDGTIRTFSRGGSDVTGAIVARGARAEVYENWTDVSGLLMADPRIVDNPRPIEAVTYKELRELAYMGASVLHDEAIFPVREAGIPVNIRNTHEPDHPGTMIVPSSDADEYPHGVITGIAGRKDFTVIAIEKSLMNAQLGFGRRVLEVLESNDVSFEHMPTGIDTLSVVVADCEVADGKLETVVEELTAAVKPDAIDVFPNMALIATVGRGMMHTPGMSGKLFGALGDAGVNVRMIDQGSGELNIIVGVEADDFETAMRAIYTRFVSA